MSRPAEFDITAIPANSKRIFSFSVDFPEGLGDLARQSFLASSGFCPEDRMAEEMTSRLEDGKLSMPVLAARGAESGQTLITTAGVHGDEYEGMEAIYRVFEALNPKEMKGTFIALPILTLPAFWLGIRSNPIDLKNMARVFPGDRNGTFNRSQDPTGRERPSKILFAAFPRR